MSEAPPWLLKALTPFITRHVALRMAKENPGLSAQALAARMRADLGSNPDPAALAMIATSSRSSSIELSASSTTDLASSSSQNMSTARCCRA